MYCDVYKNHNENNNYTNYNALPLLLFLLTNAYTVVEPAAHVCIRIASPERRVNVDRAARTIIYSLSL